MKLLIEISLSSLFNYFTIIQLVFTSLTKQPLLTTGLYMYTISLVLYHSAFGNNQFPLLRG